VGGIGLVAVNFTGAPKASLSRGAGIRRILNQNRTSLNPLNVLGLTGIVLDAELVLLPTSIDLIDTRSL
jgi:hypothetical protein